MYRKQLRTNSPPNVVWVDFKFLTVLKVWFGWSVGAGAGEQKYSGSEPNAFCKLIIYSYSLRTLSVISLKRVTSHSNVYRSLHKVRKDNGKVCIVHWCPMLPSSWNPLCHLCNHRKLIKYDYFIIATLSRDGSACLL